MIKVRYGIFETNSSSVHSLVMCSSNEMNDWEKRKTFFNNINDTFISKEEAEEKIIDYYYRNRSELEELADDFCIDIPYPLEKEYLSKVSDELFDALAANVDIYSASSFYDSVNFECYETFKEKYTTNSGEIIYAFGYYGHD